MSFIEMEFDAEIQIQQGRYIIECVLIDMNFFSLIN